MKVRPLTEHDMHKGSLHGPNNTHCLIGWIDVFFLDFSNSKKLKIENALLTEIKKTMGRFISVPRYNDNRRRRKSTLARLFNKVMVQLGHLKKEQLNG